ncbi:MAG TPA: nitroreductase [Ktedonobacter sp.]|nr:nitroreductase [Ktedonobacter sp.]
MTLLNLTPDELLATTRSVRKRLDFSRPVEPELIRECLELAVQAPTGSNTQQWQFVVVTDAHKKQAIGEYYRQSFTMYRQQRDASAANNPAPSSTTSASAATMKRVRDSSQYLADRMHEVPVMVIPCIKGRTDGTSSFQQAGVWGSILPAAWSFMLAARARGLGTTWTTLHLMYEREVAEILGIPYEKVMQAALIPVAYTLGTDFKAGPRIPLDSVVHWEQW